MSLFQRARAKLNLSPGERAVLKIVQGLVMTALAAAITAGVPLVEQQRINWQMVIAVSAGAFVVTFGHGLTKYFTSQGDTPLATVTEQATDTLAQKLGVNTVKTPS